MRIDPDDVKRLTERIMETTHYDWHRWSDDGNTDALDNEHEAIQVNNLVEDFLSKRGILVDYNYN